MTEQYEPRYTVFNTKNGEIAGSGLTREAAEKRLSELSFVIDHVADAELARGDAWSGLLQIKTLTHFRATPDASYRDYAARAEKVGWPAAITRASNE